MTNRIGELPIHELGFTPRLTNILEEGLGIVYVADLCKFTEQDLLALPNFGDKLLLQVKNGLELRGVALHGDDIPAQAAATAEEDKEPAYEADDEAFG